jgi:hypothetical protein
MSSWQGSRYPAVAKDDLVRELYLTSLGRIAYPSGSIYPTTGHPTEFQFSWEKGRIIGDFTLLWIEDGHGDAESAALGRVSILPGTVLLLPPGEWHRYRPTPKSGWVERWICANGTFLHRLKLNGVFPSTSEPFRSPFAIAQRGFRSTAEAGGQKLSLGFRSDFVGHSLGLGRNRANFKGSFRRDPFWRYCRRCRHFIYLE